MIKNIFVSFIAVVLLLGCSSKEYYKPENVQDSISTTGTLDADIIELTAQTATLEDGTIITKDGHEKTLFPASYRFVFKNDEWALALKTGGEIYAVKNTKETKIIKLSRSVATVALKDNILAVIFADNELALYDFKSEELLFKEPASEATAIDIRIANPRFLNNLVLFPTLDGKIVIVDADAKETVRKIIVSSEQYFNNIIYFNIVDDVLFAATPYKIYALGTKESRIELESRAVVANKKGVWAATKQGEVISLTHNLEIIKKQKFPFAHFLGMVVTDDFVYVAEKQEYIITLPLDLSSYKVYDFDLEDGYFFTSEEGFYFGDEYIKVK